jgi:hypothetical protein
MKDEPQDDGNESTMFYQNEAPELYTIHEDSIDSAGDPVVFQVQQDLDEYGQSDIGASDSESESRRRTATSPEPMRLDLTSIHQVPIDVTFESGLDTIGDGDAFQQERDRLERSHSVEVELPMREGRTRHHSSPDFSVQHEKLLDELRSAQLDKGT